MTDQTTNRIYTIASLVLIVVTLALLAGCAISPEAACQKTVDRFPAGMVADWDIDADGACIVQINLADGTPGDWFPARYFIK